jgi:MFS family permease
MSGGRLGRPYGLLWAGSCTANLADGILLVGAPLLAVSLTREPFLVSATTAAVWLPWLLFALLAGALCDRYDRRRIVIATNLVRAGSLFVVATMTALGGLNLVALYAVVLAVGVAEVFADATELTLCAFFGHIRSFAGSRWRPG